MAANAEDAWTFERALGEALVSFPEIRARQMQISAAEADKKGAEWQRFPTPSVEVDGRYSQTIRLDQPVWTGGRISAGIEAATHRVGAAEASADEARRDVALKVAGAWSEALHQQMRQSYAMDAVKNHERLLAMISNRVGREVSPPVDRDFAKSRLLQAQNDLSTVTQAQLAAQIQLSQLVGAPVMKIAGSLETTGAPMSLDSAISLASAASPTLKRLEAEELAADQDVVSKRSVMLPTVSLRLQRDMGDPLFVRQDTRLMVVVTAQPGAGLSAMSGVSAAVARRDAIRFTKDTAHRDLRQQVVLDWNEMSAARVRLENARQSRSMAAEVFESYARQYTTGRKSWIDVLNSVREQMQSDLAEADALAQVAASTLRLRILTGEVPQRAGP